MALEGCLFEILRLLIYTLGYWTGCPLIWLLSCGRIKTAPFIGSPIDERFRGFEFDWSIWSDRSREIKAWVVCLVGVCFWTILALVLWYR